MGSELARKIAVQTGVAPEKVAEVVALAIAELHRLSVVGDKGVTDAAMEACFSFSGAAAFHFIGILATERAYHGDYDQARLWSEVAMRFIPQAHREGVPRVAEWLEERTAARKVIDARQKSVVKKSDWIAP